MDTAHMTNTEATELKRDLERLRADLKQIRSDLTQLGGDAYSAAKAGAAEAKEKVEQKVRAAAAKGRDVAEQVGEEISSHPYVSIAAAFAVGMVLGFGFSRRD